MRSPQRSDPLKGSVVASSGARGGGFLIVLSSVHTVDSFVSKTPLPPLVIFNHYRERAPRGTLSAFAHGGDQRQFPATGNPSAGLPCLQDWLPKTAMLHQRTTSPRRRQAQGNADLRSAVKAVTAKRQI